MNNRRVTLEEIINRYTRLIDKVSEDYNVGSEGLPTYETDNQVTLSFKGAGLTWLNGSFEGLARILMDETLIPARFTTRLALKVPNLEIDFDVDLIDAQLVFNNLNYGVVSADPLPHGAVGSYNKLKGFLTSIASANVRDVSFEDIMMPLNELEANGIDDQGEQHVEIIVEVTFLLIKQPLLAALSTAAPSPEKVAISCFLFPKWLGKALTRASLQSMEKRFCASGKKTVIVVFGAWGSLQGDFWSVCGQCPKTEIQSAFKASDPKKSKYLASLLNFRTRNCNLQFTSHLMPESLRTVAFSEDGNLLAIQSQLKRFEALTAVFSLANRVSRGESDHYKVYFEGKRTIEFLIQKEDIRSNYINDIIALYDWSYENVSYDKIIVMRNVIARDKYYKDFSDLLQRASEIIDSAIESYQFYLNNRVETFFETRRKIREMIDGFARETAGDAARLTKEINDNLYKTAGLIAAAVIAAVIKPENTLLILTIGGGVLVVFLLSILTLYLPKMRTQFDNRTKQYEKDVELFSEALGEKEIEKTHAKEVAEEQRSLFKTEVGRARRVYIGFIIFTCVIVVLGVFLII